MDIRVVETMPTSGVMIDSQFRINAAIESVSLDWDEDETILAVVDYNLNYSLLPWQLGTELVKKVFLTYNGFNCETGQLTETVVTESAPGEEATQLPGYNNSNEWHYNPATWSLSTNLQTMTDPNDWSTYPYDVSQGYTIVKTFLTAEANYNANAGDHMYTAFHRQPYMTSYQAANVEGNKVYTDGWYTSYVIACKNWTAADPVTNGAALGDIVYWPGKEEYYINITGVGGTLYTNPNDPTDIYPDVTNWRATPAFEEWKALMMRSLGSSPAIVDQPIFFAENQHLVTPQLNQAILRELQQMCTMCTQPVFGQSHIDDWMKLTQKRLGAWYQFNRELFHDAQKILESTRELCYLCLYHKNCLTKSNK